MEAVLWILALLFVIAMASSVYLAVRVVRATRKRVDRTVRQARRAVEDTRLKAKQYVRPGPAGELAELRLSLRASMRATRQALDAAAPDDSSLGEATALFERLSAHAHAVDDDLRRLEEEPLQDRIRGSLPELRDRTSRITHSADSLRWVARDRARHLADDDLAELNRDIDMEAAALRHWAPSGWPQRPEDDGLSSPPDGRGGTGPATGADEERTATAAARAGGTAPCPEGKQPQHPGEPSADRTGQRSREPRPPTPIERLGGPAPAVPERSVNRPENTT